MQKDSYKFNFTTFFFGLIERRRAGSSGSGAGAGVAKLSSLLFDDLGDDEGVLVRDFVRDRAFSASPFREKILEVFPDGWDFGEDSCGMFCFSYASSQIQSSGPNSSECGREKFLDPPELFEFGDTVMLLGAGVLAPVAEGFACALGIDPPVLALGCGAPLTAGIAGGCAHVWPLWPTVGVGMIGLGAVGGGAAVAALLGGGPPPPVDVVVEEEGEDMGGERTSSSVSLFLLNIRYGFGGGEMSSLYFCSNAFLSLSYNPNLSLNFLGRRSG